MTVMTRACPDCKQQVRPCNMLRHRRAHHLPRARSAPYGQQYTVPAMPIRAGKEKDRRYDEIAPRGEGEERYRIYRLRAGDLELLATCPDPECLGVAIVTLHSEEEFVHDDSLGILDTATDPGHWIANPFSLGRAR